MTLNNCGFNHKATQDLVFPCELDKYVDIQNSLIMLITPDKPFRVYRPSHLSKKKRRKKKANPYLPFSRISDYVSHAFNLARDSPIAEETKTDSFYQTQSFYVCTSTYVAVFQISHCTHHPPTHTHTHTHTHRKFICTYKPILAWCERSESKHDERNKCTYIRTSCTYLSLALKVHG